MVPQTECVKVKVYERTVKNATRKENERKVKTDRKTKRGKKRIQGQSL